MQEECFDLPLYEWTKVDTSDAVSCSPPALVFSALLVSCCGVDFGFQWWKINRTWASLSIHQ